MPVPSPVASGDAAIQQALNGGSAGTPPPVPGYSGANSGSAPAPNQTGLNGNVTVGSYTLGLNNGVTPTDTVRVGGTQNIGSGGHALGEANGPEGQKEGVTAKPTAQQAKSDTVANQLQQFANWTTDQYTTFRNQAYQMGLTTSRNAPKSEVLVAWQTVVEEASLSNLDIPSLIKKAVAGGWNSLNAQLAPEDNGLGGTGNSNNSPDPSNSTTQTSYVSYMDPATAQGTLADAFQRLLGRNPTTKEYQAFLQSLYSYETNEATGKYDNKQTEVTNPEQAGQGGDGSPGSGKTSNTQENIISQRQIATRGAEFLAGQQALNNPEAGNYQASTTYFHAFMSALAGAGAGLSASGPTNSAP